MTRNNEVTRTKVPALIRVLYFQQYLEIMTLLEEQFSGLKDIHVHKLFLCAARHHYVPSKYLKSPLLNQTYNSFSFMYFGDLTLSFSLAHMTSV